MPAERATMPAQFSGGPAKWRREGGQATVELVLALPVVVITLLAVIQVGVVVRDRVLVVHAAREAARAAAVNPEPSAAAAAGRAATGLDPGRFEIAIGPQRAPGQRLTVTAHYRAPTRVPLVGNLIGDVALQADVTTRIE
jgi:TadE-like protein